VVRVVLVGRGQLGGRAGPRLLVRSGVACPERLVSGEASAVLVRVSGGVVLLVASDARGNAAGERRLPELDGGGDCRSVVYCVAAVGLRSRAGWLLRLRVL